MQGNRYPGGPDLFSLHGSSLSVKQGDSNKWFAEESVHRCDAGRDDYVVPSADMPDQYSSCASVFWWCFIARHTA